MAKADKFFFAKQHLQQTHELVTILLMSQKESAPPPVKLFHETDRGRILLGDSLAMFRDEIKQKSVDLIMTSPPFGLVRKKDYGNADADDYLEWFRPFAAAFHKALKPQGSLVIDIGGSWVSGHDTAENEERTFSC